MLMLDLEASTVDFTIWFRLLFFYVFLTPFYLASLIGCRNTYLGTPLFDSFAEK
jgi:hypothetical protein